MPALRSIRRSLAALVALLAMSASPAHAVSLIRDAEIESTLRTMLNPVLSTAGLNPAAVKIFIVQDDAINAYVAGGANIFIYTGLLRQMRTPDMLIGVVAHEAGHIAGGHLARGSEKLRGAQMGMILSYVLGAAAAAAGSGDAAMGVLTGGQHVLQRNMLSFSRANEQAADQAALSYLDTLGISASGMTSVFELLRRNEMRMVNTPDPYSLTHPLSKERIEVVRNHVEQSAIPEGKYPKSYDMMHQRMIAKLSAFIDLPPKTFARYPATDRSVPARLARVVAWYKIPEIEKALAELDGLIKELPNDPFLYDLRGQILFEHGRIKEALVAHEKAAKLLPDSPLILTALAEDRIATGQPDQLQRAVTDLERSLNIDNTHSHSWHLLATARGKLGQAGESHLALAEEALLQGRAEAAMNEAENAIKKLDAGSPARLRAEDLKRQAKTVMDDEKDKG